MRTLIEMSQAAHDRLTALWALAAATGCRPGELLGLDRSGVHLDDPDAAYVIITRRLVDTHDRTPRILHGSRPRPRPGRRRPSASTRTMRAS